MKSKVLILLITLGGLTHGYCQEGGPASVFAMPTFAGQLLQNGTVLLDWSTIMETGNSNFSVERSQDGLDFQQISVVVTQHTDTTTAYSLKYAYVDPSPLPGTSYYRLMMQDKSGYTFYSQVVTVNNKLLEGTRIYPTIVQSNTVFIETNKTINNARLELYDLSGRMVSESEWASLNGRQSVQLSSNHKLSPGSYVLHLTAEGQNVMNQIVIVQSY